MIKQSKKEQSARVCHTFDSNLEKISIKEKKPEGDTSVKILNQIKNIDLVVKQEDVFIIDKDSRLMYRITKGEFKNITSLFSKDYYGMIHTPGSSDIIGFYGNDGMGKEDNIIIKMIDVRVR